MSYIAKNDFLNYVDRHLSIDAWMFFELSGWMLTDEYAKLTLDDIDDFEAHRHRIIDVGTPKMVKADMAAAVIDLVPDNSGGTNLWDVQITIPIEDPHHVIGCTTFKWESRYGTQRYREVVVTSNDVAMIIKLKVRGLRRGRIDEAVQAFLAALRRRLSDISALIDEYTAALPYMIRTDLMVLRSQLGGAASLHG